LISSETAKEILPVLLERVCRSVDVREAVLQAITSHFDSQGIIWRSLRHTIEIEPLTRKDWVWRNVDEYMELHDHMSYRTVLRGVSYTFVCCSTWDLYSYYEFDPNYDSVWFLPRAFSGHARRKDLFEIEDFKVNGQACTGEWSKPNDAVMIYKLTLPKFIDEVSVSYTVNTILRKKSHYYRVRATSLTKGVSVHAGIHESLTTGINVLDFFPSDVRALAERKGSRLWTEVVTDDWVFPGQGVAITWE
jgi:hypothetical protein